MVDLEQVIEDVREDPDATNRERMLADLLAMVMRDCADLKLVVERLSKK